ncbi:mTERF domain-containing protein 1, mitochondrial [Auxenochlorella protothecoides]|uniref:mTERF domain-containing protein 1, mitochondrial n=1 Tax=Auxenochlorella protothecoides TaxID=3075 RepID=A0A087SEV2_AUXPR|nr:mTERF domain-containing protein 1, mitochondrial [Auxenochlorella protothecoides]KFM24256.1 mTERF domain-containing protein 1, mitochondrial [Auxenochlorella protothecoides]
MLQPGRRQLRVMLARAAAATNGSGANHNPLTGLSAWWRQVTNTRGKSASDGVRGLATRLQARAKSIKWSMPVDVKVDVLRPLASAVQDTTTAVWVRLPPPAQQAAPYLGVALGTTIIWKALHRRDTYMQDAGHDRSKAEARLASAVAQATTAAAAAATAAASAAGDVEHLRQQERQAAQQREPAPTPASVSPWSKKGRNRLKQVVQQVQQSSSGPQLPPVPGLLGPDEVRRQLDLAEAEIGDLDEDTFMQLVGACGMPETWRPQVGLLYGLGIRAAGLRRIVQGRPATFKLRVATLKRKLAFLRDEVGLSDEDLCAVIPRFPRLLEYDPEATLRPRLAFLLASGVRRADLARVVRRSPMLLELSAGGTLAPRAAFLSRELGLGGDGPALGALITRHPQLLTCVEAGMAARLAFLRDDVGLGEGALARTVRAHPQLLHYRVDSMAARIAFLRRTVGLDRAQAAGVVARLPQLLSLSVAANLEPKWRYLRAELGGDAGSVVTHPGYLSLSLAGRIIPRHQFLLTRGRWVSPLPMNTLKCADAQFVGGIPGATMEEYVAFRAGLAASGALAAVLGGEAAGAHPTPARQTQRA